MASVTKKSYKVLILCGQTGTGKTSIAFEYAKRSPLVRVIDARKMQKQTLSMIIRTPESSFSHSNSYKTAFDDGEDVLTFGQMLDDYYVNVRFNTPAWYVWAAEVKHRIDEELKKAGEQQLTFVIDDVVSFDECQFLLAEAQCGAIVYVHGYPGEYKRTQPERATSNFIDHIAEKVTSKISAQRKKAETFEQCMFRCANEMEKIEKSLVPV